MGRYISQVQEERTLLVLVHELDGMIGNQVIDVAGDRNPLTTVPKLAGKLLPGMDGVRISEERVKPLSIGWT